LRRDRLQQASDVFDRVGNTVDVDDVVVHETPI
jgi:hypothetical protein